MTAGIHCGLVLGISSCPQSLSYNSAAVSASVCAPERLAVNVSRCAPPLMRTLMQVYIPLTIFGWSPGNLITLLVLIMNPQILFSWVAHLNSAFTGDVAKARMLSVEKNEVTAR